MIENRIKTKEEKSKQFKNHQSHVAQTRRKGKQTMLFLKKSSNKLMTKVHFHTK